MKRWVRLGALVCLASICRLAFALDLSTPPSELARMVIGGEPGSASVAVWRGEKLEVTTLRNGAALASGAVVAEDLAPLYEIGSISKLFTGLLLAQAVEQGDLQLSDTLGSVLKDQVQFSSPEVAAITLQQLVTHGSCLPRQFGNLRGGDAVVEQITKATRAEMWAALAAQKIAKAGPCSALYSNYGMSVLAEALSLRYGKPWPDLVRERITLPLAMADTQVVLGDKAPRFVAAYAGRTPPGPWDMLAFVVRSHLNIFRAYVPVGPDRFTRPAGGARMMFARAADGQVNALTLEQGGRVYRALRTDAPVVKQPLLGPGVAAAYVGRYVATRFLRSPVEFNVRETLGQLMIRSTSVDWQPVYPVVGQADRFRYDVPAELQFERDAAGAVTGLVLLENGALRAARQAPIP